MACHLDAILLHLGCSYHLHSSHHFLSTWGVVMLVTVPSEKKKVLGNDDVMS